MEEKEPVGIHRVDFETVGIVGGGVMGIGLARHFLSRNLGVTVIEANEKLAELLHVRLIKTFEKEVERGKTTDAAVAGFLERLRVGSDISTLSDSPFVIEAVPEDLSLKRNILKRVEDATHPEAIIASNTSAIPISALASSLRRARSFLGTHFFNPAHIMPLVEVVPGIDTDSKVLDQTLDFLRCTGKKPVRVKECPGFLVNRILGSYMNEVMWILGDTAGIKEVEEITKELGLPLGPVSLGEMTGWDIICAANDTLANYYGERFKVPPLLKRLVSNGRYGIKTGIGLLDHSVKPPAMTDDLAVSSKSLTENEKYDIKQRLLCSIFAESLRCLDEGVCQARDIDTAMRLGAGFPKGPLEWADEIGLGHIMDDLKRMCIQLGSRFWPPPILQIAVLAGYTGKDAGRGLGGVYPDVHN